MIMMKKFNIMWRERFVVYFSFFFIMIYQNEFLLLFSLLLKLPLYRREEKMKWMASRAFFL